jgi:hypothetical protein
MADGVGIVNCGLVPGACFQWQRYLKGQDKQNDISHITGQRALPETDVRDAKNRAGIM